MGDLLIPAVVIGGVTYVAMGKSDAGGPPVGYPIISPNSGSPLGNPGQLGPGYGYDYGLDNGGQAGFGNVGGRPVQPDLQAKIDLMMNVAARQAYGAMTGAARMAAADQLNKELQLDPPLRGNETWDDIARVAGGAVGGAACTAFGAASVAPLCAIAGAYLGVKLEDWVASGWDQLERWMGDNIAGGIGDAADWVRDKIGDAAGWISDLF
jgi:hypothetical protein